MQIFIPKNYTVGGQIINVKYVDSYEELGSVEVCTGELTIADTVNGKVQTPSSKENTFLHELVHSILDTMGETKLSDNEKFVSCFSGFLAEAIRSAE